MNITIFGASGYVGRAVVALALQRGHHVTVFVHSSSPFRKSKQLRIVRGDAHRATDVAATMAGSDAVVSTLGSLHGKPKDIVSSAMRHIVPAMQDAGIRRLVTLTGNSAFASFDKPGHVDRLVRTALKTIAPGVLTDAEEHIRLLQDSPLDWTVLRAPPILKWGKASYRLDTASPRPWQTIPRQAVATALLDLAESDNSAQAAPFIHRG